MPLLGAQFWNRMGVRSGGQSRMGVRSGGLGGNQTFGTNGPQRRRHRRSSRPLVPRAALYPKIVRRGLPSNGPEGAASEGLAYKCWRGTRPKPKGHPNFWPGRANLHPRDVARGGDGRLAPLLLTLLEQHLPSWSAAAWTAGKASPLPLLVETETPKTLSP